MAGWPGGPGPPLFFRGSLGGPNLRIYFYNNTSARMCLKLNKPTVEIETQERAEIQRCFLYNFVCGMGEQKKCHLLLVKNINLRLVNVKLSILTFVRQISDW